MEAKHVIAGRQSLASSYPMLAAARNKGEMGAIWLGWRMYCCRLVALKLNAEMSLIVHIFENQSREPLLV